MADTSGRPTNGPGSQPSGTVAGKLMFGGEYAIVTGHAPAVAVAAGHLVSWRLVDDSPATLTMTAFDKTASHPLVAIEGEGLWGLARQVIRHLMAQGWQPRQGVVLEVGGHVGGRKLGLGTSAALTIALLRAAAADRGETVMAAALVEQGLASHGAAQGGRGSGYDIATLAHGGLIGYRQPPPVVEALAWPEGLQAAALWTGRPADTAKALLRGVQQDGAGMAAVGQAAAALLAAFQDGSMPSVLDALANCERAFTDLSARHRHLIPEQARILSELILRGGGICRTSGAGGGDCMIAFADDPGVIDGIVSRWRAAGGVFVARMPADIQWMRA
jgi:phosphomevalonate kinase